MPTAIKMWEIKDGKLAEIPNEAFSASHKEADLENWIAESPDILGEPLLIIDRQWNLNDDRNDERRLDLLALDRRGCLVVIELKRDMTPRLAVAQALDYASWLDACDISRIRERAQSYLQAKGTNLEKAWEGFVASEEQSDVSADELLAEGSPRLPPKIILAAPRLDAAAERIITYLAERHEMEVNAVFFTYTRLDDGKEMFARTMLVPEDSKPKPPKSPKRDPTEGELVALAQSHGTDKLLGITRKIREIWKEESRRTYDGSFRYWACSSEGQWRMVLGINVGGKNSPPAGELNVWVRTTQLSEVTGRPEEEVKLAIQDLPSIGMHDSALWVRLKTEAQAEMLVSRSLLKKPRQAKTPAPPCSASALESVAERAISPAFGGCD